MPPTVNAPYKYVPKTITAKLTAATGTAAELVGQVISVDDSGGDRDTDEQKFIGLPAAVRFPMSKGAREVTLTLKAISTEFEAMCKTSYDNTASTLTVVLTSEGINYLSTAVDVVTKVTTFVGYVSSPLRASSRAAGETEEYAVTLQIQSEPTVTITGGVTP